MGVSFSLDLDVQVIVSPYGMTSVPHNKFFPENCQRIRFVRDEGYASGENEQDHPGQNVPMVERGSERQLLRRT
jgi:hypothetical protein